MPEPAAPRPDRRWWNRATTTILALGALAGAIGAILGLRTSILDLRPAPEPPDPVDSASIKVQADSPVSLSEAQAWLKARASKGAGSGGRQTRPVPVRQLQPDPSSQADPTSDTAAPEPSSSSPDTAPEPSSSSSDDTTASSSGSTSSTPPTTDQPTSTGVGTVPSVQIDPPAGFGREQFGAHVDKVLKGAGELAPLTVPEGCMDPAHPCVLRSLAGAEAIGTDGKPVEPEVAAERLVELLRDTRAGGDGSPAGDGSRASEPLGVLVTVNLELIGLRDQEVQLTWSMLAARGAHRRLYGDWLNDNLSYRLKAGSNRDTAFEYIWIPLPKPPGPYYVRVELTVDGAPLKSEASDPFD
jgi:hypothetical protein